MQLQHSFKGNIKSSGIYWKKKKHVNQNRTNYKPFSVLYHIKLIGMIYIYLSVVSCHSIENWSVFTQVLSFYLFLQALLSEAENHDFGLHWSCYKKRAHSCTQAKFVCNVLISNIHYGFTHKPTKLFPSEQRKTCLKRPAREAGQTQCCAAGQAAKLKRPSRNCLHCGTASATFSSNYQIAICRFHLN